MSKDIQSINLQKRSGYMEVERNFIGMKARQSNESLIDWIFESYDNLECIESFEKYLWDLYEKESYSTILAIIKSLHILNGLMIPESLERIIQGEKQNLCSSLVYEILMDVNESIVDFENDI